MGLRPGKAALVHMPRQDLWLQFKCSLSAPDSLLSRELSRGSVGAHGGVSLHRRAFPASIAKVGGRLKPWQTLSSYSLLCCWVMRPMWQGYLWSTCLTSVEGSRRGRTAAEKESIAEHCQKLTLKAMTRTREMGGGLGNENMYFVSNAVL